MATLAELENAARAVQEEETAEHAQQEAAQAARSADQLAEAKTRILGWFIENDLVDPVLADYLTVSQPAEHGNAVGVKLHVPGHTTITLKARWVTLSPGPEQPPMLVLRHNTRLPWAVDQGGTWPDLGSALVAARRAYERVQAEAEEKERQTQERLERRAAAIERQKDLEQARIDLALGLVKRYPALLPALKLFAAYLEREGDVGDLVYALENQAQKGWAAASQARQDGDNQQSADMRTIRDLEHRVWQLESES